MWLLAQCRGLTGAGASTRQVDKSYVDATLGMLKTLQGDLKTLDDVELARLSGVCTRYPSPAIPDTTLVPSHPRKRPVKAPRKVRVLAFGKPLQTG